MSLRPLDMQVFLPKVEEVARGHHTQNQQEQIQQQQFAAQMQKQSEQQQKQVTGRNKAEGGQIEPDKEMNQQRRNRDGRNTRERANKEEEDNSLKDPSKGNLLDIKV